MTDRQYDFDVDELASRLSSEVLPAWGMGDAKLKLISVSENLAFRIDERVSNAGSAESYVLRIHRPGYHTLDELVAEQLWTNALDQWGIDVPIPVKTIDDRGYLTLAMPEWDQPRYVGLARWMDGRLLIDHQDDDLADHYHSLGEIMASMHDQATRWNPPVEFVRHSFDADGLMGEAPFWGRFWEHPALTADQQRLLARVRQALHHRLSQLSTTDGGYSMIHADMHQGNILIDGDQLRIIDFDDAGFGFHLYDIAVALFHLRYRDDFAALRDSILAGYTSVREPRFSMDDLSMFLLIRGLAWLGWIADRPEIDQSRVPGMIQRCLEMSAKFSVR